MGWKGEPSDLAARVTASADTAYDTLSITATGTTAEQAADTANVFAKSLVGYLRDKDAKANALALNAVTDRVASLERAIAAIPPPPPFAANVPSVGSAQRSALLSEYQAAYEDLAALRADTPTAGLTAAVTATGRAGTPPVIAAGNGGRAGATTPTTVARPPSVTAVTTNRLTRPWRALLGSVIGLLLGLGLVLLLDWVDPRLRTGREAEEAFGLPVLAEIPRRRRLARRGPKYATGRRAELVAEAYRQLRALLLGGRQVLYTPAPMNGHGPTPLVTRQAGPPQTILITSAGTHNGTTATVANLGSRPARPVDLL